MTGAMTDRNARQAGTTREVVRFWARYLFSWRRGLFRQAIDTFGTWQTAVVLGLPLLASAYGVVAEWVPLPSILPWWLPLVVFVGVLGLATAHGVYDRIVDLAVLNHDQGADLQDTQNRLQEATQERDELRATNQALHNRVVSAERRRMVKRRLGELATDGEALAGRSPENNVDAVQTWADSVATYARDNLEPPCDSDASNLRWNIRNAFSFLPILQALGDGPESRVTPAVNSLCAWLREKNLNITDDHIRPQPRNPLNELLRLPRRRR